MLKGINQDLEAAKNKVQADLETYQLISKNIWFSQIGCYLFFSSYFFIQYVDLRLEILLYTVLILFTETVFSYSLFHVL